MTVQWYATSMLFSWTFNFFLSLSLYNSIFSQYSVFAKRTNFRRNTHLKSAPANCKLTGLRFRLVSFKKIDFGGWTLWRGGWGVRKSIQRTLCMEKSICESSLTWYLPWSPPRIFCLIFKAPFRFSLPYPFFTHLRAPQISSSEWGVWKKNGMI